MSKRKKLLQRFRDNDKNVRFDEMDGLLNDLGFDKRGGGSHFAYTMPGIEPIITIIYRKPFILPVYVRKALQIIDEYFLDDQE